MIDVFYVIFVSLAFTAYAVLDICSLTVRVSGALANANAIGSSYEKMINTIKRTFIVIYPPVLGILLAQRNYEIIFFCIISSYIISGGICLLIGMNQKLFLSYFFNVISKFKRGSTSIGSFFVSPCNTVDNSALDKFTWGSGIVKSLSLNKKLTLSYLWVGFVYSSSIFFINSMAILFVKYNTIILQMIGFYSAFGTILLSFLIDPEISSDLDERTDLDVVLNRMIYSQIIIYWILSPIFFIVLYGMFIFGGSLI